MQLIIKSVNSTVVVDVEKTASVQDVKRAIEDVEFIPAGKSIKSFCDCYGYGYGYGYGCGCEVMRTSNKAIRSSFVFSSCFLIHSLLWCIAMMRLVKDSTEVVSIEDCIEGEVFELYVDVSGGMRAKWRKKRMRRLRRKRRKMRMRAK